MQVKQEIFRHGGHKTAFDSMRWRYMKLVTHVGLSNKGEWFLLTQEKRQHLVY
uniref:Uncharacterized protein n=1 Tax=Physcomitrium patens TaxID=3218 RepID=A0A2K1ITW9_PHYPA|nr:hypothetical protein PHYPA_024669 [Physcomitrium patens]